MNPPQVYMCSPSWTLLPPPSPYILDIDVHRISWKWKAWHSESKHKEAGMAVGQSGFQGKEYYKG